MSILQHILIATWRVTQQMAPFMLFGFLMAGLVSVFLSPATVQRHLGKRNVLQTIKAALFGVPIPLCSCSVVPVSASLYRQGAGKGATLSFLASTPQTGVDSIAVTWSLLGPLFAFFRVLIAFISGITAGVGIDLWDKTRSVTPTGPVTCASTTEKKGGRLTRIFRYGFVTLPADIGRAMLIGLLLSGMLTALIPDGYFSDKLGPGFLSMLVMMAVGVPLYICSSASVPIAYGFIRAGISPGAALVFLVTGPATNAATLAMITRLLGRRAIIVYLTTITVVALLAGLLMDAVIGRYELPTVIAAHAHNGSTLLPSLAAVVLLLVLAPSLKRFFPSQRRT